MKLIVQACIAFGAISFCSALAEAQQQHIGDPGPPAQHLTWRNSLPDGTSIDVTYFINPAGFSPNQGNLIRQAAAAWSSANTGALVNLVEVGAPGDITVTFFGFLPQGVSFSPHTPGAPDHPDGHPWSQINSAGINMNSLTLWHSDDPLTPVPLGEFDFYSYILREFGYALGLGDADLIADPGSVMDPSILAGEERRTLSIADMQSLQILYGAPEPATMALFGMGLAALCLSRIRRKPAR